MKRARMSDMKGSYPDQTEHPRALFPLLSKGSTNLIIGSSHDDVRLYIELGDGVPVGWRTIPPMDECSMADYDVSVPA